MVSPLAMAVVFVLTYTFAQTTVLAAASGDTRAGTLAQHRLTAPALGGLPEGTRSAVLGLPGVRAAEPVATTTVVWPYRQFGETESEAATASVLTPGAAAVLDLGVREGRLDRLTGNTVAVSSEVAGPRDAGPGREVRLVLGDGARVTARVVAVYSRGLGFGPVVLSRDLAAGHTTADPAAQSLLVRTDGSAAAGRALAGYTAAHPGLALTGTGSGATAGRDTPPEVWINLALVVVLIGYLLLSVANRIVAATAQRRTEIAALLLRDGKRFPAPRSARAATDPPRGLTQETDAPRNRGRTPRRRPAAPSAPAPPAMSPRQREHDRHRARTSSAAAPAPRPARTRVPAGRRAVRPGGGRAGRLRHHTRHSRQGDVRMRRPVALRLSAATAVAALAAALGAVASTPEASAATGGATGYATQNGGTTGGAGGRTVRATTGTAIHQALCGRASSSTPITIEVEGTVNHGNTSKVSGSSCSTAAGVIELKQISNVTIVGVGGGAVFDQVGIHIRESSNIIIQNVTVRNVKKSGSPTSNGGDAIGMESDVRNVWVDHATLEASGGESEGYDGLFDMKDNTQYVTLSYSILRNSGRGGLIGSSESDRSNGYVTFHHNLYENIDSRTPLLRGGIAHIYNNHYAGLNESGINSRAGARAKVDHNYFEDSKDVLGTFYTDQAGYWQVSGNIFDNVTWSSPGGDTNPAGPDPQSNTTVSIPYAYTLDQASCVPDVVSRIGGRQQGAARLGRQLHPAVAESDAHRPRDAHAHRPRHPRSGRAHRHQPQPLRRCRRLQQGERHQLRQRPRR
ncbi:hypothetical protein SFUMM280S_11495 [Streptomyces fumanus]